MSATLVINQPGQPTRTMHIAGGSVSIGRAQDNPVSLDGDTNVSRYHAIIQARAGEFWLTDLGSANGTTINGAPLGNERRLEDGDLINLGGTSTIEFRLGAGAQGAVGPGQAQSDFDSPDPGAVSTSAAAAPSFSAPSISAPSVSATQTPAAAAVVQPQSGGLSPVMLFAAIGGALLLVAVVALILVYKFSGGCDATVRIISPQAGATIRGPVPVRVEAEETACIDRVIFQLDGEKIASAETAPYDVILDPSKIENLSGGSHILSVTVEDEDGNRKLQTETVLLAFEAGDKGTPPDAASDPSQQSGADGPAQTQSGAGLSASIFDIKEMSIKLARQISVKGDYIYDNEFLKQVQARTSDYLSEGYYERARVYRDVINDSFVGEQGIEAPLGYVMAMSRTGFSLTRKRTTTGIVTGIASGDEPQGLWLIQPSLAQTTGYIGRCGTQTLADPDQKCSALVASSYIKFLEVDIFAGDFLYAVACFSLPPKEAAQFRDQLPVDRRDFWNVLKSPEQRDRVVRFFAAGIVCENPQKFGLSRDKPLSNLYPKK